MMCFHKGPLVLCYTLVAVTPLLSPPGGLFISSPFEGGGAYLRGGLIQFRNNNGISSP